MDKEELNVKLVFDSPKKKINLIVASAQEHRKRIKRKQVTSSQDRQDLTKKLVKKATKNVQHPQVH